MQMHRMMKLRNVSRFVGAGLGAAVIMVAGCGKGGMPCGYVSGKVTYEGKPVEGAAVNFQPVAPKDSTEAGRLGQGVTDASGVYKLSTYTQGGNDGAVIGKHKVSIVGKEGVRKMGAPPIGERTVPQKYNSTATSGLEAEVKSGSQEINFDLKPE